VLCVLKVRVDSAFLTLLTGICSHEEEIVKYENKTKEFQKIR
jgi:hypothetical protein